MFKFGFSVDKLLHPDNISDSGLENCNLQWLPSKEVLAFDGKESKYNKADVDTIKLGSENLLHIKPTALLNNVIRNENSTLDESVILAEKSLSDLIPSKYEGGFKIWECTYDLASFLSPSHVTGKAVLDLGCGGGLLGILALKLGADIVHFQDYNDDVLQNSTILNVQLNAGPSLTSVCKFFSGDWSSFAEVSSSHYDLIITSETIYNPVNYSKLHDCIQRVLKPSGTVLIGAKSYYFGVGGSAREFEQLVRIKDVFSIEVVWKCTEGVQREILQLRFKSTN